ncbi:MAG: 3,4-dihydroxy-2-butanone-4-phosphate synthase [Gammaproteobacteria bacterium]|nr:3,4-dihydroxy-2-butanone-4-phosphate synthase [Gammaproteobacteria bacterium]
MKLNSIEEIIDDIRQGKMVILMDDEDRENEGDLIIAAERVRTEDINFMATNARGLICLTLTQERCKHLKLPLMVNENNTPYNTNFTVSIEAAIGVTTGISASDRARTIQVAVGRDTVAEDIVQPGHIFPIMAQPGGVLRRAGHTEAGCDLTRLAGYSPAAAIVEIMNEDGSMARRPDLEKFAEKHGIKIGTIVDLIHYRIANEHTVTKVSSNKMETKYGEFDVHSYKDSISGSLHLAFTTGGIDSNDPLLVRVHIPNTVRDICDVYNLSRTSWSFSNALEKIAEQGKGVAVLLSGEDYGQDLDQNIANVLSDGSETASINRSGSDLTIGTGSQILRDLGVGKMRLLSYPAKLNAISGFDLEVVEFVEFEK